MATNNNIPVSVGQLAIYAGGAVVLIYYAKRMIDNQRAAEADAQISTNDAAGQARALDAALHPAHWYQSVNTANILAVAPQITDYKKVQDFYRQQTGKDLDSEVNTALQDDYTRFLALATKGKTGNTAYATTLQTIPPDLWIVTKAEANIRKSPKMENKYTLDNNIVRTVRDVGKILGKTTGKFVYDSDRDVTYLEFYTFNPKTAAKLIFYVAKSQVELLTDAQRKPRESSLEYEEFSGLKGVYPQPTKQVVSRQATTVYTEAFLPIRNIPARIIVGFPLLTIETDKGKYTKVQTVQGLIRWVKTAHIQVQNRIKS